MTAPKSPRMTEREFAILADEFLRAHQPAPEALAGFAERVYQLGYEHGWDDGGSDTARQFTNLMKG